MRVFSIAALLIFTALLAAPPAHACAIAGDWDPTFVRHAETVVVGRISNYERVQDPAARERRRRMLENPNLSPALREALENQTGFMSDYARFRIHVRETLAGSAPRVLTVTWNNSTFSEPNTLRQGEYLVALSSSQSEPGVPSVLQSPCSPAFILPAESAEAREVRQLLAR